MPRYRRNYQPGGTYFFTVNLRDRRADLLTRNIHLLKNSIRQAHYKNPFKIHAWVVLPDHLHCIWTLPEADSDFSLRWQGIKAGFSRRIAYGSRKLVWQDRFWEHTIRNEKEFKAYFDYIHINPLKHGHVDKVAEWPFSTFHRHVASGVYSSEWGGGQEDEVTGWTGE